MATKRDIVSWAVNLALRELPSAAVPAIAALGILFAVASVSGSQSEPSGALEDPSDAPLCGQWHPGAGESRDLDLGAVKRAYQSLRIRVGQALDREAAKAEMDLGLPYNAGLPACRGEASRGEALSPERGIRARGKTLLFLAVSDLEGITLPPEIEKNPAAQILVVRMRHLADLGKIAEKLGRPVSLASAEFARALGVRCANTWLKVTENGDAFQLHEVP